MIILDVSVLDYHVTIDCTDYKSANSLKLMLSQNNYNFSFLNKPLEHSINIKYSLNHPPYNLINGQEILLHKDCGNEGEYLLKGYIYKQYKKTIIHNPLLNVFIEKYENKYILYGKEQQCFLCIVDLLREQIFQKYYEYHKYTFLKCAAFAYNENNLCVIIGSHKSGKTTFLLNVLNEHQNFLYVTNSASYINCLNNNIILYSWRPHLRIRNGTCKSIHTLTSYYDNKLPLESDILKIKTYHEFNEFFSNSISENGIIKKIIFVQPSDSTSIQQLNDACLIDNKLMKNIKLTDESHPNYLNLKQRNKSILNKNLNKTLLNMHENIDFYQLNYNVQAKCDYSNILHEVGIL